MVWRSLILGFLWGAVVSVGNHYYLQWVLKKNREQPPDRAMLAIVNCYIVRYFVNVAALFLVYRDMWMLLGTGIGLTLMKNVNLVRQYRAARKTGRRRS